MVSHSNSLHSSGSTDHASLSTAAASSTEGGSGSDWADEGATARARLVNAEVTPSHRPLERGTDDEVDLSNGAAAERTADVASTRSARTKPTTSL